MAPSAMEVDAPRIEMVDSLDLRSTSRSQGALRMGRLPLLLER